MRVNTHIWDNYGNLITAMYDSGTDTVAFYRSGGKAVYLETKSVTSLNDAATDGSSVELTEYHSIGHVGLTTLMAWVNGWRLMLGKS